MRENTDERKFETEGIREGEENKTVEVVATS